MANLTDERAAQLLGMWGAMGLKDLAIEFKRLKEKYDDEKAISAHTYAEFELLRKKVLPETMDEQGFTTVKIEGVGRIQIGFQVSAKQLDKMALFEWMRDNGHEALIAEVINASTLGSFMKTQIAQGEPIPDSEIVDFTSYEVASVVKA